MTGAECLLRTLIANRVNLCFMNPGTSEMQFVSALDRVPEMRGVLCLHETVCAGAADGYARMMGWPAAALLHLGPGLANGLSNFHNARKARSPVVNIVGEHSTGHLKYDAPLTADVEAFARTVSGWVRTVADPVRMGHDASDCVRASFGPPGQVASLIIPADHSWNPAGEVGEAVSRPARSLPELKHIDEAANLLRNGQGVAILLGGSAICERGLRAASRTGARVFLNRYAGRAPRGREWSFASRIPYFPEPAWAALSGIQHMILVEAAPPVSFFGYPGMRSTLAPEDCRMHQLAAEGEDGVAALESLPALSQFPPAFPPAGSPENGALTPETVGLVLASLLPEGAIISDEMVSSGEPVNAALKHANSHELLPVTGGSIGQGLPVAVGAAMACPDRKVLALEADGSAMYSLQALWTMARENLDIVVVIFNNRRYRILDVEMARTSAAKVGPLADLMMDIGRPAIDWVALSRSMGVEASRAATVAAFRDQLHVAITERGPRLIEVILPPAD